MLSSQSPDDAFSGDGDAQEEWAAYHGVRVLGDPGYLRFMTDKLLSHRAISPVVAADLHRDVDPACAASVAAGLAGLSMWALELVGL